MWPPPIESLLRAPCRSLRRLRDDQRGSISILSVFAALALTMLLGMVMNVGRQVDGKVRLQNAADAVAVSGGVMVARELNALAFSNHLLCEVFALTAILREADPNYPEGRNSDRYIPSILAAWNKVGEMLQTSGFPKFVTLGQAIVQKVPLEQELVRAFSDWMAAASPRVRPVLEEILRAETIPAYQRTVRLVYPDLARMAAEDVAERASDPAGGRGTIVGCLWRGGSGEPVDSANPQWHELLVDPLLDPAPDRATLFSQAIQQRNARADQLRRLWNDRLLTFFDRRAQLCQYANLWRSFTCAQLQKLLAEYPDRNVPFVLRGWEEGVLRAEDYLDGYFTFVGVTYWRKLPDLASSLFQNRTEGDALAFAQVRVFLPKARLVWLPPASWSREPVGGLPGVDIQLPGEDPGTGDGIGWHIGREGVHQEWDLFNQNWTAQLVPASVAALEAILQTPPPSSAFVQQNLRLPNLAGSDLRRLNTH